MINYSIDFSYEKATAPFKNLFYHNPLFSENDVKDFILEGSAEIDFPNRKLRLSSIMSPELGQAANYVYWCDKEMPSDQLIEWEFTPLSESGLCIMFFSAKNIQGGSIFDAAKRTGPYNQYHSGEINAFHVSYYRIIPLILDGERLRTCNLRKSRGFHMASQGADPIPELKLCKPPFLISIVKHGSLVSFYIDKILCFTYNDDGKEYGSLLEGGHIGFRQIAPMTAEYSNLKVYTV